MEASESGSHLPQIKPGVAGGPSLRSLSIGLLVLFSVAVAGLLYLARPETVQPGKDFLTRTATSMQDISVFVEATTPHEVYSILSEQTGWRVEIPSIRDTKLRGVGFTEAHPGVDIPVLIYREDAAPGVFVSVVSYAFLDTHEEYFTLAPELLDALSSERALIIPPSHANVLLWRNGDEIFIASTAFSTDSLAARIQP